MKSRQIPARFKGKCRICGKAIPAGEAVWFAKHYGVRCTGCGPHTDNDQPLPSKRSKTIKIKAPVEPVPKPVKVTCTMPGQNTATRCADGVWRYEVRSVQEAVLDALDDYAQNDDAREKIRSRMEYALSGRDAWANRFTQKRFMKELAQPRRELLDAVDAMREQLIGEIAAPACPRRKVRRGQEWGEEIDPDRWLAREIAPWERNVRQSQPRHTVTIGCNLAVNAHVKPHQLLYRGAAALALADILTSRGVNVAIHLFDSVANATSMVDRGVICYVAKDHLMPLDVSAVALAMCEIAFFRVVGALGGSRHWPGTLNEGLGRAISLPANDRSGLDYLIDSDVLGEDEAAEWLRGCLAASESEVCHV